MAIAGDGRGLFHAVEVRYGLEAGVRDWGCAKVLRSLKQKGYADYQREDNCQQRQASSTGSETLISRVRRLGSCSGKGYLALVIAGWLNGWIPSSAPGVQLGAGGEDPSPPYRAVPVGRAIPSRFLQRWRWSHPG